MLQDSSDNTHASQLFSPPCGHSRQERKNISLRRNSPSSFGCATRRRATRARRTSPEKAIALGCRSAYSPRWFCDSDNVRSQPTPQGRVSSPHPESEDVSRWHLNPDSDGCTLGSDTLATHADETSPCELSESPGRGVSGAVIDNNDFFFQRKIHRLHLPQGLSNRSLFVLDRNDDRDSQRVAWRASASSSALRLLWRSAIGSVCVALICCPAGPSK
jgi:hypothetical protein